MDINVFQAKWSLKKINFYELPSIASEFLEKGFDSPSLRIIAGLDESEDPKVFERYSKFTCFNYRLLTTYEKI